MSQIKYLPKLSLFFTNTPTANRIYFEKEGIGELFTI